MTKDAKPRSKVVRGSTRRIELHLSNFLFIEMVLTCSDVGHLFKMLMAEAAEEEIPPAPNSRVQRAFDRRNEYRVIKGAFGRTRLPLATRKMVFERDGKSCRYCSSAVAWEDYHCDHIEPVALGGSDDLENLAVSCRPCNLAKAAKPLSEWVH